MLNSVAHVMLRQQALQWALATCQEGEGEAAIIRRAEAYLAFVLLPTRDDVAEAMAQRAVSTTH